VRINGKIIRLVLVAGLGLLAAGCSGINSGTTVSPASFFLPGLLKADPAPDGRILKVNPDPVMVIAQAR
jgi:hypothetical protein